LHLLRIVSLYFSLLKISTVAPQASRAENVKTLMNIKFGCYRQVFDHLATLITCV